MQDQLGDHEGSVQEGGDSHRAGEGGRPHYGIDIPGYNNLHIKLQNLTLTFIIHIKYLSILYIYRAVGSKF